MTEIFHSMVLAGDVDLHEAIGVFRASLTGAFDTSAST